jgi:hypothetical protein
MHCFPLIGLARRPRAATAAALALLCAGCPTVVRPSPDQFIFHSGFPLVGIFRTDGALCSLASVGPDVTRLPAPPEALPPARPLDEACRAALPAASSSGRTGVLVHLETEAGPVDGYLYSLPEPQGVLVAFAGMAMPTDGWINQRFAEEAARRGLVTFAQVRAEDLSRPIEFDPAGEARRGVLAAGQLVAACLGGKEATVGFVGISMGGLEGLLAGREAGRRGLAAHTAVLDPVLDPDLVAKNLDSTFHGVAVDSMQDFFRRILLGRYAKEPTTPSFHEVLGRVGRGPKSQSKTVEDAPRAWLCSAPRDRFRVFLSTTDPVLGDEQRDFAVQCQAPLTQLDVPGHTPLACDLGIFGRMVEAAAGR